MEHGGFALGLRRLAVALVACTAGLVWAAHASAGVFGTTAPGGTWGCPGANFKYGNEYALTEDGSVTQITAWMKGAGGSGSQVFRAMIYAADGPGGGPGTLLATTADATVPGTAAAGAVAFAFATPVALTAGDYWLAQQSGTTGGAACLSATSGGTNSFNVDAFADGPSNPFDVEHPIQTNANVWTLSATYDVAAADTTPPTITAAASPAPNANGWNDTDVTVTFSCQDEVGGSGVATVSGPVTLTAEGANQTATGSCTDNAGNDASATASGISIDKTDPTVAYGGNAGTYTVDRTIAITCTASDSLSGVATSSCADVAGPAYGFGVGAHTVSASATDKAGNEGGGSATFTVVVDAGSLCRLTQQFVASSPKYAALRGSKKAQVDALWNAACRTVASVTPRLNSFQKRLAVGLYEIAVRGLDRSGWLTGSQASTLIGLAGDL